MSLEQVTKIEVLQNAAGKWFWRAKAANGRVVATAGQAFATKADAKRAAERTKEKIAAAPIVVVDDVSAQVARLLMDLLDGRPARRVAKADRQAELGRSIRSG
jgi:uncharacterized protein YegP (UPF0339 family)